MENKEQRQSLWENIKQNYRLYVAAFVIVLIAELIGMKKFQVGSFTCSFFLLDYPFY